MKFLTPASSLEGYWDPYPIDMEFRPPCMVLSTIGISKPGKLEGKSTQQCSTHLHQLHVCLPSSRNKTRLLYRMSLDFAPVLKHVPFMQHLWRHFAEKVPIYISRLLQRKMKAAFSLFPSICTIHVGLEWRFETRTWTARKNDQWSEYLELARCLWQTGSEI